MATAVCARAQTVISWASATSGSWTTSANWSPAIIPNATTDIATITATGSAYTISLGSTETVGSLLLNSANATLSISGVDLGLSNLAGSSAITAGTLQLSSGAQVQTTSAVGPYTLTNAGAIQSTSGTNLIYSSGGVTNGMAFTNTGTVSVTGGTLYLGNSVGDTVTNLPAGTITANGATLVFNGGAMINTGTLQAINGGIIDFSGNYTTAGLGGTINGAGGILNLMGNLTNNVSLVVPASGIYTLDGATITGGNVLTGALTFSSGSGVLNGVTMTGNFNDPSGATFHVENGTTFSSGTTTFVNNYLYLAASGNALTVSSDETFTGNVTIQGGAANEGLANDGIITNSSGTNNIYGGSYTGFTFTNNGTVNATGGTLYVGNGGTDTINNTATGVFNASGGASIILGYNSHLVTNASGGLLEATAPSSTLTLGTGATTWTNLGTITASGGGTVNLGGNFTTSSLTSGTINGAGGTLNITGNLDNSSTGPLNAPNGGGGAIFTLAGGTITGGTVNTGALTFGSGGHLSGVSMVGNFNDPTSAYFFVDTNTTFSGGTTNFVNNTLSLSGTGTALTIGAGETFTGNVSIQGNAVNLGLTNNGTFTNSSSSNNIYGGGYTGFTFTNNGTVNATGGTLYVGNGGTDTINNTATGVFNASGGASIILGYNSHLVTNASGGLLEATAPLSTLTLGTGATTWTNLGTITASGGGTVNLGGNFTTSSLTSGTINGAGGTLNITGNLDNSSTGPLNAPNGGGGAIFTLAGGTITGGTVNTGALTFGSGGTLSGVSLVGNFNAPSSTSFYANNDTTFTSGTTSFGNNYVYLGGTGTALTIGAGETFAGNVTIQGTAASLGLVNNGIFTNSSGGNNIYGGSYTGFVFTNNGTVNATGGTLYVGNSGTDTINNGATGVFNASGGGNIILGYNSHLVTNASGGLLEATTPASTLTLGTGGTTWTNTGTITASGGGTVNLGGSFATSNLTSGTINGAGGTLNITGSLDNSSGPLNPPDGGGGAVFTLAGGSITGGSVNTGALKFGAGGTLNGVSLGGNFSALPSSSFYANSNTTFSGGTTTFGGTTLYLNGTGTALTIGAGGAFTGSLTIQATASNLTLVNNGSFTNSVSSNNIYGGGYTGFTFTNNGMVSATTGTLYVGNGGTDSITNAAAGTIEANGGNVDFGYGSTVNVVNNGLLLATGAGSTLTLGTGNSTWTNSGSITASSGGVVDFAGSFTTAELIAGPINGFGGTLAITGQLNNASAILPVPASGVFSLSGGTITGGTVAGSALTFTGSGGNLDGVTMSGSFNFPAAVGASFFANTGTLFTGGTTAFTTPGYDTVNVNGTGTALTIDPTATWSGSFNIIGYAPGVNVANQGTMTYTGGTNVIYSNSTGMTFANSGSVSVNTGTLDLGYYANDTISNTGSITANNGTVYLGYNLAGWSTSGSLLATNNGIIDLGSSFTTAQLGGTVDMNTGGVVNITGNLNNAAATLNAPHTGVYTLSGGKVTGGTVASGALTFSNNAGTLSGVTMNGNFSLPSASTASFYVTGSTTFTGGTTAFATANTDYIYLNAAGTNLILAPSEMWTGDMAIYNNTANPVGMVVQGILDHSSGSTYFYGNANGLTVTNSGTIESAGGGTLTVGFYANDSVTNSATGTFEANGGTLDLDANTSNVTNLAGGTLSGGTWMASNGGTLNFLSSSTAITTIAPATTVVLDGATSNIFSGPSNVSLTSTLTTNSGTLEVLTNRNFPSASAITNNGTIQLGGGVFSGPSLTNNPGSVLSGFGTFGPTGGVTVGSNVLVSPGSASANNYVASLTFNSATLGQGGSYVFDLDNASGTPGVGYDTINVTGALTVTATNLSPFTVSIESINPGSGLPGTATFNMAQSYQWTLLAASSVSGFNAADFVIDSSNFQNSLGGGAFTISANATDIFLNFTPVPEPSTWALAGTGLAAIGFAALRRRRRLAAGRA